MRPQPLCGRAGFASAEELGDHAAECFGEAAPASPGGGAGDDEAARRARDEAAVLAEVMHLDDLGLDEGEPRRAGRTRGPRSHRDRELRAWYVRERVL